MERAAVFCQSVPDASLRWRITLRTPTLRKNRTDFASGKVCAALRMSRVTFGSKLEAAFAIFGKLPIPQYAYTPSVKSSVGRLSCGAGADNSPDGTAGTGACRIGP